MSLKIKKILIIFCSFISSILSGFFANSIQKNGFNLSSVLLFVFALLPLICLCFLEIIYESKEEKAYNLQQREKIADDTLRTLEKEIKVKELQQDLLSINKKSQKELGDL